MPTNRIMSEWSAAPLEVERINYLLYNLDDFSIRARCYDKEAIVPTFSILIEIWVTVRPLLYEDVILIVEHDIEVVKHNMNIWLGIQSEYRKFPFQLFEQIETLRNKVMYYRQQTGLAVRTSVEFSTDEKIRTGVIPITPKNKRGLNA
jgi:hypothetical protein